MKSSIHLKRIYQPFEKSDGYRVLVDRLWPRGITKEIAHIDVWLKDIAPSNELRKWIHATPEKWQEFEKKYMAELNESTALEELIKLIKENKTITLLYSAKNEERNNATVLKEFLENKLN